MWKTFRQTTCGWNWIADMQHAANHFKKATTCPWIWEILFQFCPDRDRDRLNQVNTFGIECFAGSVAILLEQMCQYIMSWTNQIHAFFRQRENEKGPFGVPLTHFELDKHRLHHMPGSLTAELNAIDSWKAPGEKFLLHHHNSWSVSMEGNIRGCFGMPIVSEWSFDLCIWL